MMWCKGNSVKAYLSALLGALLCLPTVSPNLYAQEETLVIRATATDLFGGDVPDYFDNLIDAQKEFTFDLIVPESYSADRPAGILVFISPTPSGVPPEGWRKKLSDANLIWVAARDSGNTQTNGRRKALAIFGKILVQQRYIVDPSRTYLSGFSGGGRMSSFIILELPHLFGGAIYFCGVNYVEEAKENYADLKEHRFVFLTGTRDFNYTGTRFAHRKYKELGIENALLIVVPELSHELPSSRTFARAVRYLDEGRAQ